MHEPMKTALLPLLALGALLLGGCSTPAKSNAMIPTAMGAVKQHPGSLEVEVTGGSETSAAGAPQISNGDFEAALEQAVRQSGLFAGITPAGQAGDYHLAVHIVQLQQPMFGFAMTATIETNWILTRRSDQSVIWREAVASRYTAKTGEALVGATRLRLATEGAARNNIQDAIARIGSLVLP